MLKLKLRKKEKDEKEVPQEVDEVPIDVNFPEGYEVAEDYWIEEPYSKIFILFDPKEEEYLYYVSTPVLNEYEKSIYYVVEDLIPEFVSSDTEDKVGYLRSVFEEIVKDIGFKLSEISKEKIFYYLKCDFIEFGPITPLMKDRLLEDISCNGYGKPIYVYHRNYQNLRTNVVFSEDELDSFIIKLAQQCGKHISIAEPMLDATLPDGSRIQMTLGREVTDHGSTFTIRKFRDVPLTPIDLIAWRTFSLEEMAYLWLCIENKKNLIFAGGTASGKTTSMNAISLFIPKNAKIVSIEDTREVMLPHENWIPAVTREGVGGKEIDMYELLRAALRQRPEYIIVGEVRGKEALTLFQAMSTGHTTYSTLHADSVNGVIHRLENPPINVPRSMIEALDIISIQAQVYLGNKRVRRNLEIAEIVGMDPHTKIIKTTTVFAWDSEKDEHLMIGSSKVLEEIRKMRAWSRRELEEELETRKKVLKWMLDNNIRDYKEVAKIIHSYQSDKDSVLRMIS
ncbi:type II secretion system protein E [Ferroglobus placidus DSM 10642]|uniref:Type II secretion system protein E n=1 Tax=Ferroglobus placidus (strain DSM 10642 / AEDII12DO) TaxID=589924 RepID=D3S1X7_FERPA|nr:type II/IV secretion system ATPase subunit [Ferroglobus placidus]ADC64434.1 type II secretion system protein E [Ferroglobus placidus DSM 10642]